MSCVTTAAGDPDGEIPRVACPKCGAEVLDFDGFGFVACPECEFCTHPSSDGPVGGPLRCNICRRVTSGPECVKAARGFTDGAGI